MIAAEDATAPGDDAACERCGQAFHCGAHDALPCACTSLKLSAAVLAQLRRQYRSCLCLSCLATLAEAAPVAADSSPN